MGRSENLKTNRKQRRKRGFVTILKSGVVNRLKMRLHRDGLLGESDSAEITNSGECYDGNDGGEEEEGVKKGSVGKFVSQIGERIRILWG